MDLNRRQRGDTVEDLAVVGGNAAEGAACAVRVVVVGEELRDHGRIGQLSFQLLSTVG